MLILRKISDKHKLLLNNISSLNGGLDNRNKSEILKIFGTDYWNGGMEKLEIKRDGFKMSAESQEFLISAFLRYNATFPISQRLISSSITHGGTQTNKSSIAEFFIRSLIMARFEEGVKLCLDYPIIMAGGEDKGNHEMVLFRGDHPLLIFRMAKLIPQKSGSALEQSFTSMVFELFSAYYSNPIWPLYGCVSDLSSWIFLKFDGEKFYKSDSETLEIDREAILNLSHTILSIIESKQ